jgi:hypothetical protein
VMRDVDAIVVLVVAVSYRAIYRGYWTLVLL